MGVPPKVAGGLGLELEHAARWTHRNRLQFQRALAVVVVHELAHALAGASHRSEGLMSPQLRREQLLNPKLVVGADLHPALLAGVARLQPRATFVLDAPSRRGVPSPQP